LWHRREILSAAPNTLLAALRICESRLAGPVSETLRPVERWKARLTIPRLKQAQAPRLEDPRLFSSLRHLNSSIDVDVPSRFEYTVKKSLPS